MGEDLTPSGSGGTTRRSMPLHRIVGSAVLIVVPVALGLAVPLYQRHEPALAGIPFFYWFQMSMAVLSAIATGTVFRWLFAGEADDGEANR